MSFDFVEPNAYDLDDLSAGAAISSTDCQFLTAFFEEEGMALHLRHTDNGCAFYVNPPPDAISDIMSWGISDAALTDLDAQAGADLVLQSGTGSAALNIPFYYDLSEPDHIRQLHQFASVGCSSLYLLEGTGDALRYRGRIEVTLPQSLRAQITDLTNVVLG